MASGDQSQGVKKGLLARFKEIGGTPEDYPPWRLIYNFQYYIHCKEEPCAQPICNEVKALMNHRKDCVRGRTCDVPNCWMYAPVAMHYSSCSSTTCVECTEIMTKIAEYKGQGNTDDKVQLDADK